MAIHLNKKPLLELRESVQEQSRAKFDHRVSPAHLSMTNDGSIYIPTVRNYRHLNLRMTDWAQGQLFTKLGMPHSYSKKMLQERPDLISGLANHHFTEIRKEEESEWFVRTYNNNVARAFLSNRYSTLDNDFLVDTLIKYIANDHNIKDSYVDDRSFHLRITFPDLTVNLGKMKNGRDDIVQCGLHIINSEVGNRSLTVESVLWRQVCTNGLVVRAGGEVALHQRHVHLRDLEIQGRVKEAVAKCIQGAHDSIDEFEASREREIHEPINIINQLAKQQKYSQKFVDSVTTSYQIERERSGDTEFTLINALTDSAKQLGFDQRVEVEKFAGTLLFNSKRLQRLDKILEGEE